MPNAKFGCVVGSSFSSFGGGVKMPSFAAIFFVVFAFFIVFAFFSAFV